MYLKSKRYRSHREWRGVVDTLYDYSRWLYNWFNMFIIVLSKPRNIKAMFRYRWMSSYLAVPMMVDRHTQGLRGEHLRICHAEQDIIIEDVAKLLDKLFRGDRRIRNAIAFIEEHTGEKWDWTHYFECAKRVNYATKCRLEWLEMSKTPYPQVFGSNLALYTETNYMAISGRLPVFEETDRSVPKRRSRKRRWQQTNTVTEPSCGAFSRITTWTSSCGCSIAGELFLLPICCQWIIPI